MDILACRHGAISSAISPGSTAPGVVVLVQGGSLQGLRRRTGTRLGHGGSTNGVRDLDDHRRAEDATGVAARPALLTRR